MNVLPERRSSHLGFLVAFAASLCAGGLKMASRRLCDRFATFWDQSKHLLKSVRDPIHITLLVGKI